LLFDDQQMCNYKMYAKFEHSNRCGEVSNERTQSEFDIFWTMNTWTEHKVHVQA